jgi:hypothetical protein
MACQMRADFGAGTAYVCGRKLVAGNRGRGDAQVLAISIGFFGLFRLHTGFFNRDFRCETNSRHNRVAPGSGRDRLDRHAHAGWLDSNIHPAFSVEIEDQLMLALRCINGFVVISECDSNLVANVEMVSRNRGRDFLETLEVGRSFSPFIQTNCVHRHARSIAEVVLGQTRSSPRLFYLDAEPSFPLGTHNRALNSKCDNNSYIMLDLRIKRQLL